MLTPQDIESKMFKVSLRGYNTEEVDDFLQEICESFVSIYMENQKNREKVERLSEAVGQYKSMEGTLQDALSVADKSTGEIEKEALRKAAEIVKNAEKSAECILEGARRKAKEEEEKVENIKREIELYRQKITDLINAQLNILNGYPASGRIDVKTAKKKVSLDEVTERLEKLDMKTEDLPKLHKNKNGEYIAAV